MDMANNQAARKHWRSPYSMTLRLLIKMLYPRKRRGYLTAVYQARHGRFSLGTFLQHERKRLEEDLNYHMIVSVYDGYWRDGYRMMWQFYRIKFLGYFWDREVSRWWDTRLIRKVRTH